MDRRFRFKIAALIVALTVGILIVLVLPVSVDSGSGDSSGSSNFITIFLPIWIAIFVPIFAARQKREHEKAKHRFAVEDEDIYSMMNRLVGDLDDDEMDYLKRRLQRKFGSTFGEQV